MIGFAEALAVKDADAGPEAATQPVANLKQTGGPSAGQDQSSCRLIPIGD